MLYTALFSKGWVKKATTKEIVLGGNRSNKMGDVRRIGKYKIPRVYGRWHTLGDIHSKLVIIARSTGLGF